MMRIDFAVVGGGVSGLYSAYRLKQAYPNKKVVVFEALPFTGGRIQTGTFLDGVFKPGYGAHVIEPDYQTEMHKLIQELGIPLQKEEDTTPRTQDEEKSALSSLKPKLDKLTDEERQYLKEHPMLGPDVALLDLGLRKILGSQWNLDSDHPANKDRDKQLNKLKAEATFDGQPLYQQGAWNVFASVLSHEAIEFCREKGSYFNMKNDNQNAAEWIALLLNKRLVSQAPYIPENGMIGFIRAMEAKLSQLGVDIRVNHRLTELRPASGDRAHLKFELASKEEKASATASPSSTDWVAEHVVLAIPQAPLKKLAAYFPKNVSALLDSVIPIKLLLVAAALKSPPWSPFQVPHQGENVPMRAAIFEHTLHQSNPYGLTMFWCDGPWREYWSSYVLDPKGNYEGYQAAPQVNQNPRLKKEIEKNLQQLFATKEPPTVAEYGIRDWGRAPFGAGVHFWKPGAQSYTVIQQLKAFSLNENSRVKNIHVCGEAFSERQGYCEGAIRTSNRVVRAIRRAYQAQISAYSGALFAAQTPRTAPMPMLRLVPGLQAMSFTANLRKENELAWVANETLKEEKRRAEARRQAIHDKQFALIPYTGPR